MFFIFFNINMNSKLLFLLLLILLFVVYNFLTYENFGNISNWDYNSLENLSKQKFGLSSNDNLDTHIAITTDSSKHLNNTTQTEIDGKLYDLNSFRFSKLFSLSQKYLNVDENSEINTKIVYTDEEKNKIIEKFLQTNLGDSVGAFTRIFGTYNKPGLAMIKKYIHYESELDKDDNNFYIIYKDLNFKLNDSINDYFKDSELDLKDDLRDKIFEFEKIINFIKSNYNHNDIQAIVIDVFLLNIGIIMKDEFKIEVNDDFINFNLKFKVDIYNNEFEGRKLNFKYTKFKLIENSYFIDNKIYVANTVISEKTKGILDNDPQMKKINELKKNMSVEVKLGEKYKISLEILSILFSDEKELANYIFSKNSFDYINVRIDDNYINSFQLRNLMVLDEVVNDFKFFKLKNPYAPSNIESFSNMCEDLTLENGEKYVDNELQSGYTCADYAENELCKDKKTTDLYFEDIANLSNLTAKDACCVCGGGKNTEQSQSSNDEESNDEESNDEESNNKESNDKESNNKESNDKESNDKESNDKESNNNTNNKSNRTSRGKSVIQYRPKGPANIFLPELKIK